MKRKEQDQMLNIWDADGRDGRGKAKVQRRSVQRKRARQKRIAVIFVLALGLSAVVVALLCSGIFEAEKSQDGLAGVWAYDQYTEYEFDGKGNGCMCIYGNEHFEYTYKVKDGVLYLDFALDYVTDCQYEYTVDSDKLILIGGKGTAEIGKVYNLIKK